MMSISLVAISLVTIPVMSIAVTVVTVHERLHRVLHRLHNLLRVLVGHDDLGEFVVDGLVDQMLAHLRAIVRHCLVVARSAVLVRMSQHHGTRVRTKVHLDRRHPAIHVHVSGLAVLLAVVRHVVDGVVRDDRSIDRTMSIDAVVVTVTAVVVATVPAVSRHVGQTGRQKNDNREL